jgi:hypothetical protein
MFNQSGRKGNANQNMLVFLLAPIRMATVKKKQQITERIQGEKNPDVLLVRM